MLFIKKMKEKVNIKIIILIIIALVGIIRFSWIFNIIGFFYFEYNIHIIIFLIGIIIFIIDAIKQKKINPKTVGKYIIGINLLLVIELFTNMMVYEYANHLVYHKFNYIGSIEPENKLSYFVFTVLAKIMNGISFVAIFILFIMIIKVILKYLKYKKTTEPDEKFYLVLSFELNLVSVILCLILNLI